MADKRRQQFKKANASALQGLRKALSESNEVYIEPEQFKTVNIVVSDFVSDPGSLLFTSLPRKLFKKHPISYDGVERDPSHERWEEFPVPPSKEPRRGLLGEPVDRDPYATALELKQYFDGQLYYLPRKDLVDSYFSDFSRWDNIYFYRPFDSDEYHPFYAKNPYDEYNLLSADSGETTSRWTTEDIYEYLPERKSKSSVPPHLILVTCHDVDGEDGKLLRGELAAIVGAMYNRSTQVEFATTFHFPVFMVSLFGPQHGRLLQAHFSSPQQLTVRATECYSFEEKENAPIQLFLSFLLSEPRDVPILQFPDWNRPAPDTAASPVAITGEESPAPVEESRPSASLPVLTRSKPEIVVPSLTEPSSTGPSLMEPSDRD